jgi:hypothetical protein
MERNLILYIWWVRICYSLHAHVTPSECEPWVNIDLWKKIPAQTTSQTILFHPLALDSVSKFQNQKRSRRQIKGRSEVLLLRCDVENSGTQFSTVTDNDTSIGASLLSCLLATTPTCTLKWPRIPTESNPFDSLFIWTCQSRVHFHLITASLWSVDVQVRLWVHTLSTLSISWPSQNPMDKYNSGRAFTFNSW